MCHISMTGFEIFAYLNQPVLAWSLRSRAYGGWFDDRFCFLPWVHLFG